MTKCYIDKCERKVRPYGMSNCKHCKYDYCLKHLPIDLHECDKLNEYVALKKEILINEIIKNKYDSKDADKHNLKTI